MVSYFFVSTRQRPVEILPPRVPLDRARPGADFLSCHPEPVEGGQHPAEVLKLPVEIFQNKLSPLGEREG